MDLIVGIIIGLFLGGGSLLPFVLRRLVIIVYVPPIEVRFPDHTCGPAAPTVPPVPITLPPSASISSVGAGSDAPIQYPQT